MSVQSSKKNLAIILSQTNPAALPVRVLSTGSVQVTARGSDGTNIPVTLESSLSEPDRQYDLLQYAPPDFWRRSSSLSKAIDDGLIDVDAEATAGTSAATVVPGPTVPGTLTMVSNKDVSLEGWELVGTVTDRLSDYDAVTLTIVALTGAPSDLEVQFYNYTQRTLVATVTFSEETPTIKEVDLIPIPSGLCLFEVRARLTTNPDPENIKGQILFAGLRTKKKV